MKMRRRPPKVEFIQVANAVVRDYRLSWRARGLLVELLSYPPGFEISVDDLVKRAQRSGGRVEGRDAMRAAARELKAVGYIVETRRQDARGRWHTELEITDDPMWQMVLAEAEPSLSPESHVPPGRTDDGKPVVGSPVVGSPVVGEPGVSTNTEKNTETKEGEEGDARARASADPPSDGGGGPAAGAAAPESAVPVAGGRAVAASVMSLEFVEGLAREVLPRGTVLSGEDHQELAALLDEARPVVDAVQGLAWGEFEAYLRQGWWKGARKRFESFPAVLRTRLNAQHIRSKAVVWAAEQRADRPGVEGAHTTTAPGDPFTGTLPTSQTCLVHGTVLTADRRCANCEAEAAEPSRTSTPDVPVQGDAPEDLEDADLPEPDPELTAEILQEWQQMGA